MKKITAIIVNYDEISTDMLEKCITSIRNQTLEDIHFIMTDFDGFNSGKLETEYVTFVNAEDWLVKDAFESMYRLAKLYNAEVVKTGAVYIDRESNDKLIYEDYAGYKREIFERPVNLSMYGPTLSRIGFELRGILFEYDFLVKNNIRFNACKGAESIAFIKKSMIYAKSVVLSKIKTVYHYADIRMSTNNIKEVFKAYDEIEREDCKVLPELLALMLSDVIRYMFELLESIEDDILKKQSTNELLAFIDEHDLDLIFENEKNIAWIGRYSDILERVFAEEKDISKKKEIAEKYFAIPMYSVDWRQAYAYATSLNEDEFEEYLVDWYYNRTGDVMDFNNARTYGEKIQWLKLYDTTPLKIQLSDKLQAREWVAKKIGEKYLVPLLGIWDCYDDIDFDNLPDKFVMKMNKGFHTNLVVNNKKNINHLQAKYRYDIYSRINWAFLDGFEPYYMDVSTKIIAEPYLGDTINDGLLNCNFFCFNGQPKYVWIRRYDFEENNPDPIQSLEGVYDMDWNFQDFTICYPRLDSIVEKPICFDKMARLASILCKDFAHVRVDFMYKGSEIYFSEMTFGTANGILWDFDKKGNKMRSIEADRIMGDLIKLPEKKSLPKRSNGYEYGVMDQKAFGKYTPSPINPYKR